MQEINTKVSMNRQPLLDSPFFSMRRNNVKWPTLRKGYLTDDNVELLREYATRKGRSIIFLDGDYITKLNRYVRKDPTERAVFFEFMCREKELKEQFLLIVGLETFTMVLLLIFLFSFHK